MNENKFVNKDSLAAVLRKLYTWLSTRTPFINDGNKVTSKEGDCYANNDFEMSVGKYNKSTKSDDSSKATLFSIGNGANDSDRSNAMEVKENGDIYVMKDGEEILLQDNLGGDVSSITTEEIDEIINK